jgi:tetratricopeptide (TPR) repeat protein
MARRSLEAWTRIGDRYGQGTAHNNLSGILCQLGNLDAALVESDEAVAAFAEVGGSYSKVWALNNLANVRRARGELAEAMRIYENVIVERSALGDSYGRGSRCEAWGRR